MSWVIQDVGAADWGEPALETREGRLLAWSAASVGRMEGAEPGRGGTDLELYPEIGRIRLVRCLITYLSVLPKAPSHRGTS